MSLENCSNEHNIDFIAKSFFIFMVSISFINDLYSIKETILNNEYIQKNMNKLSDLSSIFKKFISNKEKKIKDGFIIKNNELIKQKDFLKNKNNIKINDTNIRNNKNIINNSHNDESLHKMDNINKNNLSISEEIKSIENKSHILKKKKKIYNNDLMEEVKEEVKEVKEIKEVKNKVHIDKVVKVKK